jgi:hypothetical protein
MARICWSLTVVLLVTQMSTPSQASSNDAHLIPAGPNFDTKGFYSQTYAQICERLLFTKGDWMIRYHRISKESETGISITKNRKSEYFVVVKESTPPLGSTVSFAMDFGTNVNESLKSLNIRERRSLIPKPTAIAIHNFWLQLLSEVRPRDEALYIIGDHELLFAKAQNGQTLRGRLPADAFKYNRLVRVLAIVEDLLRLHGEKSQDRALFASIEQNTAGK